MAWVTSLTLAGGGETYANARFSIDDYAFHAEVPLIGFQDHAHRFDWSAQQ